MRRKVCYTAGMNDLQMFVANVNAIIEAEGLSVSEVARRADVDRAELSRLLSGKVDTTISRAGKIAKAIGVHLDQVLAGPIESQLVS